MVAVGYINQGKIFLSSSFNIFSFLLTCSTAKLVGDFMSVGDAHRKGLTYNAPWISTWTVICFSLGLKGAQSFRPCDIENHLRNHLLETTIADQPTSDP
jgi:hypothetical protein